MLRRRWWLALLCIVLLPAGVYALAASQPKVYEARVIIEGELRSSYTQVGSVSVPDPQSIRLARTHATTAEVVEDTARLVGRPFSAIGTVSATLDENTGWLTVSVRGATPGLAADAANAFPRSLRQNVREVVRSEIDIAIAQVERSRAAVRTPAERAELTNTLDDLRAVDPASAVSLPVVESADAAQAVAPNPRRDAILALVLAILIAPAVMVAAERLDRRVRRRESLSDLAAAPLLATVDAASVSGSPGEKADPETFARLRDSLTYLSPDVSLRVIAVVGPLAHDGRTGVAANLGRAFARTGHRVVIVDADLRAGGIARHVRVSRTAGLSDALRGAQLEDVVQPVGPGDGELYVVPAGSAVQDPAELLGSARMSQVLERLTGEYDIVILDTTPLLAVSDALPLLRQTSGVVCVVPLGRTPGDAVQRLTRLIRTAGGRVLGVVAVAGATQASSRVRPSQLMNSAGNAAGASHSR